MNGYAYRTFDDADVEVTLHFGPPGLLVLAVAGVTAEIGPDALLIALVDGPAVQLPGMTVRPDDDGETTLIVTPAATARLGGGEVELLCEWLTELDDTDWPR